MLWLSANTDSFFQTRASEKPGPKGPGQDLINAIVEMKRHNRRFGCLRIAMQILNAFGLEVSKDLVRHILNKHFTGLPSSDGPSWLTNLWGCEGQPLVDGYFRAESITLENALDNGGDGSIFTSNHRFLCALWRPEWRHNLSDVQQGDISARSPQALPVPIVMLCSNPRLRANINVLGLQTINSVLDAPVSHPFVERLIDSTRREFLDHILFWSSVDLERKLASYQEYFNNSRGHHGIGGMTPRKKSGEKTAKVISLSAYRFKKHCNGLYQLPTAA